MAAFRVAKGLSQAQLGEALGMDRGLVAYYERAARNPSLELVQKIADFFGVTVGELLNDTTRAARKPGPPSQFAQIADEEVVGCGALSEVVQKVTQLHAFFGKRIFRQPLIPR